MGCVIQPPSACCSPLYFLSLFFNKSIILLELSKTKWQKSVSLAIEKRGQVITDTFDDIELQWRSVAKSSKNTCSTTKSQSDGHGDGCREEKFEWSFELTFDKKHRAKVIDSYMPFVLAQAESIKQRERVLKLHCVDNDPYGGSKSCIDLVHPATFETMAMDPELKKMVMDDLDRFVRRRELYKKVGKAWKRGYLLYGPPGTGKSSLIAAMANYLKFDIYDLELSNIHGNSELRRVLLSTSNRSIVVVEDIDCGVQIRGRESAEPSKSYALHVGKFTLSGLLNFMDGLWSCCGDERIIVLTTNHKERLDPALLRPGHMDLHIHLSYCTPSGFRVLASNYLGIHESSPHHLFGEIESLIKSTEVTPAAIAEELMKNDDADVVLEGLVKFLKEMKAADDKMKSKKAEKAEQERIKKAEEGSKKGIKERTSKAKEIGTEKGKEEGANKASIQERENW
ncbi:PREDICTED: mitochondrial chaperone BCS1-like [Fragaria vesca subsp. vesca]